MGVPVSVAKEERVELHGEICTRVTFAKPDPITGKPRPDVAVYADDCAYCESERDKENTFFPSHWPSSMCESGKRPHCTCDRCF